MPGRFKSFDYYNAGGIFDALMAIFKPMLSKKMRERVSISLVNVQLSSSFIIRYASESAYKMETYKYNYTQDKIHTIR